VRIAIDGARVLLPDGEIAEVTITLAEGLIIGVGHAIAATHRLHARGLLLLPGIVDLHGDAFEKQLMPRSSVYMPDEIALQAVDRQLLANGITTAFHALSVSWEPGLRSRETTRRLLDALDALRVDLDCDTRVHLRYEALALDALEDVIDWIEGGRVDLLAFNDHAEILTQHFEQGGSGGSVLARSGLTAARYRALLNEVERRRDELPSALSRLAAAAGERALPLASHDDGSPEQRRHYRALGCRLCEFPVDVATAETAAAGGDRVLLGAPNVLRGESHARRLSARQAVGDRLCSILASDYFYPAMVAAPFRLAAERVIDFASAWRLVSANPAAAAALDDRGEIAVGKRADLVLIDDRRPELPRLAATIAAGRIVHLAEAALAARLEHFPGSER